MRFQWQAALALILCCLPAHAQQAPDNLPGCIYNATPPTLTDKQASVWQCDVNGKLITSGSGGSGTVTTVSVVTANGVSGSVANPTTTPAITLTLGAITPSTVTVGAGSVVTSSGPGGALTSLAYTTPGTGVATALGVNVGTTGGIARLIAAGAKALATGAIGSATCTAAQTDTATGTLTTDAISANFNGDPTAVTGYVPLTSGMLTIIVYPTADTVNFKVCNNTTASITPGAVTINWRVVR